MLKTRNLPWLPNDVLENIVFFAVVETGDDCKICLQSDAVNASSQSENPNSDCLRVLNNLKLSCNAFRSACRIETVARKCLSEPKRMACLLRASRRVQLWLFLRASGGYDRAVKAFQREIACLKASTVPPPIVSTLQKLCGTLFTQIGRYAEAEEMLNDALVLDKIIQGPSSPEVASTLHNLADMLRGSVSACQTARERYLAALRGIGYARECLRIRMQACGMQSSPVACALHVLGYHCAEYASGAHAIPFFKHATDALQKSNEIFARVGDDEMNATTLQDLGLCYYYQMKYKEAMHYYESACHLIMEKFGSHHPDLAVPTFNIANVMCAAGKYRRAISFYEVAYNINRDTLGKDHKWTETALASLQEAIDRDRDITGAEIVFTEDSDTSLMVDTDTSASLNTSRNEGEDIAVNLQFIVEESNSSCWQERGANKEGEEAGRSAFSIGELLASLVEDPVEIEQDEADEYDGYDFEERSEEDMEEEERQLAMINETLEVL
uniref:Kinesin light chain n=1 Tax=Guillardia theta TaxID=55529 RepID=A0A7S4PR92_GUITH|mmetsp:Transcript_8866/g.29617  ORF Transcript_8866/g.29617 Transcript_8866/m.29617 type:complete len:498 (+) Transcript_8866:160-1653(+)